MNIISKRTAKIINAFPSARLTLTNEFLDMNIPFDEKFEGEVLVTLVQGKGKKIIFIEKI